MHLSQYFRVKPCQGVSHIADAIHTYERSSHSVWLSNINASVSPLSPSLAWLTYWFCWRFVQRSRLTNCRWLIDFGVAAPRIWNGLPRNVTSPVFIALQKHLKAHLFW